MTATTTPLALEVAGIRKSFGDTVALDGIDLHVATGSVFALLGPNGAGKTTLMRAVLGLVRPDAGTIRWDTRPVDDAARRRIGYMPEERGLYPAMRVSEQVVHFARLACLLAESDITAGRHSLARQRLSIEIPGEILEVERTDMGLAREWREATRWAFREAMKAGFFAAEYCRSIRGQQGPGAYLLQRGTVGEFLGESL